MLKKIILLLAITLFSSTSSLASISCPLGQELVCGIYNCICVDI